MPAKAKDWRDCPHCGAADATGTDNEGFHIRNTKNSSMRFISCPCGIMTKVCSTETELKAVWNSRPGKKITVPKIKVKHPVTTKVNPDLLKTGDNKTEAPDEF